jgi:hypothetical protein
MPPLRELRYPHQITDWLHDWGNRLLNPGSLILIGSGGLLWHAAQLGLETPLTENSMDVDPITFDDEVAELGYEALIGSDFELRHGWHVNLMPEAVLREFAPDWEQRAQRRTYHRLSACVPAVEDLLRPKLRRGEPRDRAHAQWCVELNLVSAQWLDNIKK